MTTGRIQVDDGELSYEILGTGSPIVLLHSGMLSNRIWDEQFALLVQRHTVLRYDARGHGQSSTPTKPFSHYEDLRQLLSALDIPRAALVGLSLGSRTSIDFAIAYPELVDRLFLAAPGISGMTPRDPFVLDQMARIMKAGAAGDTAQIVEGILRMWVDGPHRAPVDVDQGIRSFSRGVVADTVGRHGGASIQLATEVGAIDRAGELAVPIRLLVGDLDSADIHGVVDLVHGATPHADKVVVAGAGHMVNLEREPEFNRALLNFLADTA